MSELKPRRKIKKGEIDVFQLICDDFRVNTLETDERCPGRDMCRKGCKFWKPLQQWWDGEED